MSNFIQKSALVSPTKRQLNWQETEFYAFVHFTVNTFTDREWGLGDEEPSIFDPTDLNAEQWAQACKSAGMRGLILTCKHHDGFCLWPSRYTDHSVKNSPWRHGDGDVVKEVSDACRKYDLKLGVYLSPWDRHDSRYGTDEYNTYFKDQLRELLSNYGDIFSVWFDGACGEGPNGKTQIYDWDGYYQVIREVQPNAVISVCGPDVRWVGNEAGHCRESEWSVVPEELRDREKIQEKSQQADDTEFRNLVRSEDEDLGSREVIRNAGELIWYPAEVNTSIRPGWFYHAHEDDKVKPLQELLEVYYQSVGGNATFLLNIPPDKRGRFHEEDVKRLKELGQVLRSTFQNDLALGSSATASESMDKEHEAVNLFDRNSDTFWSPKLGTERAHIEIDLGEEKVFNRIVLKEHIQSGQRIERFKIEYQDAAAWKEFSQGTIVGYKRILRFNKIKARYLRITIMESRWCPTLSSCEVYLGPNA
ncbi:alpha-L-fucosidase [Alicyclobacillus fodiniaquatilis]|uniref:alpha-L-fucosidase n=1 Tax=Alicyclobacillus fodiniaquatilis TaxID=1661150 RepID=A0ABW4JC93_9BACL